MKFNQSILITLIIVCFININAKGQDSLIKEGRYLGKTKISIYNKDTLQSDIKGYLYEIRDNSIIISYDKEISNIYVDNDLEIIPIEKIEEIEVHKKNGVSGLIIGTLMGVVTGAGILLRNVASNFSLGSKSNSQSAFSSLAPVFLFGGLGGVSGFAISSSSETFIIDGNQDKFNQYKSKISKYLMESVEEIEIEKEHRKEAMKKN